jgi:hypothetical protein
MKTPPYINIIQDGWISIKGDPARLKAGGVKLEHKWFLRRGISYTGPGPNLENANLIDTLLVLNTAGIAFLDDYKQGWPPADVMRELQKKGILKTSFTSIVWSGPGSWQLITNEAAQCR